MFFTKEDDIAEIESHVDQFSDSYTRDIEEAELAKVNSRMVELMTTC